MNAYLGRRRSSFSVLRCSSRSSRCSAWSPRSPRAPTDSNHRQPVDPGAGRAEPRRLRCAPAPKAVRIRRVGAAFDDPGRTLHSEWGLSLALESKAGGETRCRPVRLRLLAGDAAQQHGAPEGRSGEIRRHDAVSRPLRSSWRPGGLPQGEAGRAQARYPPLRRRRGHFYERKRPRGRGTFRDSGYLDRRR